MKQILSTALLTALLTTGAAAQELPEEQPNDSEKISTFVDIDTFSKYRFRGLNFGDDPILQAFAGVDFGNGFSVSGFTNFDSGIKDANEFSFFATYCDEIGKVGLCGELSYGTFPNLGLEDTYGFTAIMSLPGRLSPTLTYATDFNLAKGSNYLEAKVGSDFKVKEQNLDWAVALSYNDNYYTGTQGLGHVEVELSTELGKKHPIRPSVKYIHGLSNDIEDALVLGIGTGF